jgi:hypothetical protein
VTVPHNYAWAAGILEGEGCFSMFQRKGKTHYQCSILCEMTDEDTVKALHDSLGVGTFSQRPIRGVRKPTWILCIQRQKDVFDTLIRVMPYLQSRRLEKAKKMFNYLEPIVCEQN